MRLDAIAVRMHVSSKCRSRSSGPESVHKHKPRHGHALTARGIPSCLKNPRMFDRLSGGRTQSCRADQVAQERSHSSFLTGIQPVPKCVP